MNQNPSVSINLLHVLLKYAASLGVDLVEIGQSSGLQADLFDDPEARIPAKSIFAVWKLIILRSNDRDFGLHLAELTRHHLGGDVLAAVMLNSPTVGKAMEKLSRYHDLTTEVVRVRRRQWDAFASYILEPVPADFILDRQVAEAVLCRLFFTLEYLAEGKISFVEVRFGHPRPGNTEEHERIFQCPLVFDQPRNEVVFQREGLDLPIPLANPKILLKLETIVQEQMEDLYSPNTWAEKVSHSINNLLLHGEKPRLETIACHLSVGKRHLQNKLKEEEISYQTLLDQVRKEIAMVYLEQPNAALNNIAFLLGYADQSAFNHAFKRWTGVTPKTHKTK
jgi:AraC-like DNA-binding protein